MVHRKYSTAYKLYQKTDLSQKDICEMCKVSVTGFRGYVQKYHRDSLFKRYNLEHPESNGKIVKIRGRSGQGLNTKAKYEKAICVCADRDFIEFSISQIAKCFNLSPSGLGNQLRAHFPNLLKTRYERQLKRGIKTHRQLSRIQDGMEMYAGAVRLLKNSDLTLKEAASRCGVSCAGLEQHLLFYHKDVAIQRRYIRLQNKGQKYKGKKNGNNLVHCPRPQIVEKYAKALELYKTTSQTIRDIAEQVDVSYGGFSNYLRVWHRDLMVRRKGIKTISDPMIVDLSTYKHYLASTAEKYAEPIKLLKNSDMAIADIARKFGINSGSFRMYLKEHEPEFMATRGRVKDKYGNVVYKCSLNKYKEAIEMYKHSNLTLKEIAEKQGLVYISLGQYLRRNYPGLIARHKEKMMKHRI